MLTGTSSIRIITKINTLPQSKQEWIERKKTLEVQEVIHFVKLSSYQHASLKQRKVNPFCEFCFNSEDKMGSPMPQISWQSQNERVDCQLTTEYFNFNQIDLALHADPHFQDFQFVFLFWLSRPSAFFTSSINLMGSSLWGYLVLSLKPLLIFFWFFTRSKFPQNFRNLAALAKWFLKWKLAKEKFRSWK